MEFSRNPTGHGAGWFGVPRQVFCFVDFLASVAYNNSKGERGLASTRKSVRYFRDFFPAHYRPHANLLVAMWRHGTVHGFMPYSYYALDGRSRVTVRWSSNNDWAAHNQAVNLQLFDVADEQGTVCLSVNTCALADDLLESLDNLLARIRTNPGFGRACVRRLNRAIEPRNAGSKKLVLAGKRQVVSQILAAPKATVGVLRGDQVEWY